MRTVMMRKAGTALCMAVMIATFSFWSVPSSFAAAALPELPRVYIDTTYPNTSSYTVVEVKAGEDLQEMLDTVNCGTVIKVQAGTAYTGNFWLKNRGECNGRWIILTSSRQEQLPPPGTRVKPSDASNMPKILTPGFYPALQAEFGANYYWISGVEIGSSDQSNSYTPSLITLAYTTPAAKLAHHIVFDRSYIHGTRESNINMGVTIDYVSYAAVVDSYISDIQNTTMESQGISMCTGPGPYKIVNNFLEGAGENVFIGGCGEEYLGGIIESDIEIRGNHIYKPTRWMPSSPDWDGKRWIIKNSFEMKSGQRVLFEGNIIENHWTSGQLWPFPLTPRTGSWKSHLKVVNDITIRNNIFRHMPNAINVLGQDDGDPNLAKDTIQANRILVKDNIFDDVNGDKWGPSWGALYSVTGANDVTIDHNTGFNFPLMGGTTFIGPTHLKAKSARFTFTNNLHNHNRGGISGDGSTSTALQALEAFTTDYQVEKNVFVLTINKISHPDFYNWDTARFTSEYPPRNYFPMTVEEVAVTNHKGGNGGDYTLLPSSPYKNAGTDGKNIGADIPAVTYATRGAVSGVWNVDANLSPESQSFRASGGSGTVSVTSFTGGYWSAASNSSWITITSGASGTGNGTLAYSVAANSSFLPRTGTLTIAGQTFTLNQEGGTGGEGVISVSPMSLDFGRVRAGETASQQVRITNKGTGSLNVRGITFLSRTLGIFSYEGTCETVAPGESCTLSVKFTPPYRGFVQGVMKIYSNATNAKGNQVRLKGAGF